MPATHTASTTIGRFRVAGRGSNQALVILDGGPNDDPHVALIPEAGILVGDRVEGARIAAEIRERPELREDDVIHVGGFGAETYVARRLAGNPDWWRLVPVGMLRRGQRFYFTFEGHSSWVIRDAMNGGNPADRDLVRALLDGEQPRPRNSVDDARSLVRALNEQLGQPQWNEARPTYVDYLHRIGKNEEAVTA